MSFRSIKEGDIITRMLGGTIPMKMIVGLIKEDIIICGTNDRIIRQETQKAWFAND